MSTLAIGGLSFFAGFAACLALFFAIPAEFDDRGGLGWKFDDGGID